MSTTKNVEKIDEEILIPPDTEKETITEGKKPVDFMRINCCHHYRACSLFHRPQAETEAQYS